MAGRRTFEPAGGWGGDHHDGAPIFIVARDEPGIDIARSGHSSPTSNDADHRDEPGQGTPPGDRDVMVHGSGIARLALAAGVLDELELHVIPVLLGQGTHRVEGLLRPERIELERTRVLEGEGGVTHMHYRVAGAGSSVK